jgi:hypothetical protein
MTQRTAVSIALCLWLTSLAFPQEPPATLRIDGAVKQPLALTADDLARMPRASLQYGEVKYEGVWLHEILARAGAAQAESLRGKALTSYALAEASDGYQVLFSLAELDPAFLDSRILVADTANGTLMSEKPSEKGEKPGTKQGSFRLVVPRDRPGARSARQLIRIEIVQLRK